MFIEAELPKYFKDIIEQMRQRGTGMKHLYIWDGQLRQEDL